MHARFERAKYLPMRPKLIWFKYVGAIGIYVFGCGVHLIWHSSISAHENNSH